MLAISLVTAACSETETPFDALAPDAGGSNPEPSGRFEPTAALAGGPRQETAVVELGGEVFVIGGYDDQMQFGGLVEAYDPETDTWRRAADLPVSMHHANAAAAAGKIYVVGYLRADFLESDRSFAYDPALDAWTELAPMPETRRRGASVTIALEDRIYLIGGLRARTSVVDVDVFDPSTGELSPLPPLPRAMDHGTGGGVNGKLLVAGGRAGGTTSHTSRLDIFDLGTGAWTAGARMPTARGGAAGAVLDGRLYVFGGEGNRASPGMLLFDQVEAYDVALDEWTALTSMDPPRHGMGAAAVSDRIIVPGGATREGFGATATSEAFFP